MAHDPIIQREVDELLAKSAIEPLMCVAGFYSNIFVVPKYTGILWPILNLTQFICFMHILSFKMPSIRQILHLIQQGKYAFSIDFNDAYLHIPIVKHHYQFYFCLCDTNLISGRFCH